MSFAGGKIANSLVNDGTDSTVYSDKFAVSKSDVWSVHLDIDDDSTDYASAVTLWASNKPNPGEADDTDWVEMKTAHGWDGMPKGDPTGGDWKDLVDVASSGARWYRFKFVRSAGSASIDMWVVAKERK